MQVECKWCPTHDSTIAGKAYNPPKERVCSDCQVIIHMHYDADRKWFRPYERSGNAHIPLCTGKQGKWKSGKDTDIQYTEPSHDGLSETKVIDLIHERTNPLKEGMFKHGLELDLVKQGMAEVHSQIELLSQSREVVIVKPDEIVVELGRVHKDTAKVIQRVNATRFSTANTVGLVGPAGSGKTTIAKDVSRAFELPFFKVALSPQTTESRLVGFHDANGQYVETAVFKAYKEEVGAVLLIDEFDAGNSGSNVVFNSLFDQMEYFFGADLLTKSENFIPIVTMNTYGYGQTDVYVGRNKLDGATLDRIRPRITIDYDWELVYDYSGRDRYAKTAINYVANIDRANTDPLIFGPRAAQGLALLTRAGVDWDEAIEETVWCGVKPDMRSKIESNMQNREWVA